MPLASGGVGNDHFEIDATDVMGGRGVGNVFTFFFRFK